MGERTSYTPGTRFYEGLFGWQTQAMEGMQAPYRTIQTQAGQSNGGITTMPGVPPSWLVYFGTRTWRRRSPRRPTSELR